MALSAATNAGVSPAASAQSAYRVLGIAYDSTLGRALPGATIVVSGMVQTTKTDPNGAFVLDGVPSGSHLFVVFDTSLGWLGSSGLARRVVIPANGLVVLATNSFNSYWRNICGGAPPPRGGIEYGTVNDVIANRPLANTYVNVSWLESRGDPSKPSGWSVRRGGVSTDSSGRFAVCGVPTDVALTISADRDGRHASVEGEFVGVRRIATRDLWLGEARGAGGARGTIRGAVVDGSGTGIADVFVTADTEHSARTDSLGRFALLGLNLGTQELLARRIGFAEAESSVTVFRSGTPDIQIRLQRLTELSPTLIIGSGARQRLRAEIERRRLLNPGRFVDSTGLQRFLTPGDAVARLLPNHPVCAWYIDGVAVDGRELGARHPADLAVIEVHEGSDPSIPLEYQSAQCSRPLRYIVLAWTKASLP